MNRKIIAFTIAASLLLVSLFHPFNGIVIAKLVEPLSSSYIPKRVGECIKPGGGTGNARPIPYCAPGYNPNDTFSYIVPCKDITDRNTCYIADGTAIGEGFEWHIVDSRNYKSGRYVIQTSNQKSLLYEVRGNAIYFIQDTTWANATTCTNGKPAFQRINGKQGMLWAPKSLRCDPNFSFASEGTNAGFEYIESEEENLRLLPDNVTPCQAPHTGNVSGTKQLVFNGNAKCGSFSGDILVLRNESGAGAGEVFIYCKGVGLCGWFQNIDFSDPNNDPKTWVGKDICSGTKKAQETCYVQCPAEGINKPTDLSLSNRLSNSQNTSINLLHLEPGENEHRVAIQDQKHLQRVARAMLPGLFKIQKKNEQKPTIDNSKEKIITLNQNNTEITVRSSLLVKGDKVNIEKNVDTNDQGETLVSINVSGGQQMALSEDTLWNDQDCKECREQDDYNKLLGSLSSKNKTDQNTTEGIDLTKPVNRLADRIPVPNSGSQTIKTENKKANPENKNSFSGDGNTNILLSISNFIQEAIGKIFSVPGEVASCTKISNDEDLYNNTKTATYAFLPQAKINILEQLPKSGESENVFNIKQTPNSSGENVKINQAFYPTNFVNATHQFQACSVLSKNTKIYRELCNNDVINQPPQNIPPHNRRRETSDPGSLGYVIPFRDTSCVVNQDTINRAIDLMRRYYPSYQEIGTRNLENLWREIQNRSIREGINPTFALTLYIEESAACGAQGSYGMGCIYERHTARQMPSCSADPETSLSQVGCLSSYVNRAPNFTGFMCRYSGEELDSNDQCSTFKNNPNFPNGVRFWYDFLSEGQSQECQMQIKE